MEVDGQGHDLAASLLRKSPGVHCIGGWVSTV
jgi:hypothetical protein